MTNFTLKLIIELGSDNQLSYIQRKELQNEFKARLKLAILDFLQKEGIYNPKVNFYDIDFHNSLVTGKLNVTNNFAAANKKIKVLNKIQYRFYSKTCPLIVCRTDPDFSVELANKIADFINNTLETL